MVSKTPKELMATIAPEFTPAKGYDVDGAIVVAQIRVDSTLPSYVKENENAYNLLIAYLAAHTLTIGGRPMGSSGDISSMQVGAVSVTYSTNKTSEKYGKTGLMQTSFGLEYIRESAPYKFSPTT
jgi:hypothetical protein